MAATTSKTIATGWLEAALHGVHKNFVLLLVVCYALAAVWPALGLQIRDISFGNFNILGEKVNFSGPMLMLSFLLFNAGFGIQVKQLDELRKKPLILITGLIGNILVPVVFIVIVWTLISQWHNPDEAQNILVGLALIASMPIAGSSTAWSQNANGNLILSVGLVLLSTLLSPILTPLILHSASWITTGDYSEDLTEIAHTGTKAFLISAVLLPVVLGVLLRFLAREKHSATIRPLLKLTNSLLLLLLVYSNASVSLPQTIANPDWDLLALILIITTSLCVVMFASGFLIGKIFKVSADDRIALLFGLGMNNNGTGLVLASMQLADHPMILLPIIFYNLIQHLVAGATYALISKNQSDD